MRQTPHATRRPFSGVPPSASTTPRGAFSTVGYAGLLFLALTGSCGGSPTGPTGPTGPGGPVPEPAATDTLPTGWRWTTAIPLSSPVVAGYAHDGNTLESPHFLTYTDAVGTKARLMYAGMAEQAFVDALTFFQVPAGEDLGIDPADPTTKYQIVFNLWEDRLQRSYRFGFILHALGSPYCVSPPQGYAAMVEHETIHVFQSHFMGEYWNVVPPWFKEGLAEHGAAFFGRIETPEQLHAALEVLAGIGLDPATMELADLVGATPEANSAAYRLWGLIFRYLMDPAGLNRSPADILALFEDVRSGTRSFHGAFESHMGVSPETLEGNVVDWLEDLFKGRSRTDAVRSGTFVSR